MFINALPIQISHAQTAKRSLEEQGQPLFWINNLKIEDRWTKDLFRFQASESGVKASLCTCLFKKTTVILYLLDPFSSLTFLRLHNVLMKKLTHLFYLCILLNLCPHFCSKFGMCFNPFLMAIIWRTVRFNRVNVPCVLIQDIPKYFQ